VLHDFTKSTPFGGLKQQYELANRLSARGHDVIVYHSLNFDRGVVAHPRSLAGFVNYNLKGRRAIGWFGLNRDVEVRYLPRIHPKLLRRADATIMSSAAVAERLPLQTRRTGRLLYIVYEYPVWKFGSAALKSRLQAALTRADVDYVSSSFATTEMLDSLGTRAIGKVTCGIDVPPPAAVPENASRAPVIGFALRPEPYKGAEDVLQALRFVRQGNPQVDFECFGRAGVGTQLPAGLTHHGTLGDDDLIAFYRRCLIFVSPSYAEGWGLTAAEAMANGAAVVVTSDGGSRDFAWDGQTALVVPPKKPGAIAQAVSRLLEDDSLRTSIVDGGLARSRTMTWDRSVDALEEILDGSAERQDISVRRHAGDQRAAEPARVD